MKNELNELSELDKLKGKIQEKKVFTDEMFVEFEKMFKELVENFASKFVKGIEPDSTVFNQGFDEGDLADIDIQLSEENIERFKSLIKRLTFVKEAFSDKQREELGIDDIIEQGKFSKKMKNLHKTGINGIGTSIGIIDSCSGIDKSEEFDGRDVESIVIYKNNDGVLAYGGDEKEDRDDFHGKTTATLAAGNNCGVAPKARLYLFKLVDGVKREEARDIILQYIKRYEIELDVLIDPSYNKKSEEFQKSLDKLTENDPKRKKCVYFSTEDCWKNCIWGRYSGTGTELVEDEIAKEIINQATKTKNSEEGMEDRLKVVRENDDKVLIPCTGMTSLQEKFKNKDKYYGSVCGNSFPTTFLGSLFALGRQINSNITKDNFFEIMRNTAKLNTNGMKYLDSKALLKEVEQNKILLYFHDQKSNQYFEDMKTGKYSIPASKIGKVTINAPTQEKKQVEHEETENMITEDKINKGESLGD